MLAELLGRFPTLSERFSHPAKPGAISSASREGCSGATPGAFVAPRGGVRGIGGWVVDTPGGPWNYPGGSCRYRGVVLSGPGGGVRGTPGRGPVRAIPRGPPVEPVPECLLAPPPGGVGLHEVSPRRGGLVEPHGGGTWPPATPSCLRRYRRGHQDPPGGIRSTPGRACRAARRSAPVGPSSARGTRPRSTSGRS